MNTSSPTTRPETSKVAVFERAGEPFVLDRLPIPQLSPGELLVRIECCTICGSDLHTITGQRSEATPSVLGHEVVGTVEEIAGEDIRDLRESNVVPGDRVVWSITRSCHDCRNCRRGIPQKCEQGAKFGHHPCNGDWQLSGGFAEFCHLPVGMSFLQVEPNIPTAVLCPASCVTATAAAAIRLASPTQNDRVLIFGAGLLGLTTAAMLSTRGTQSITVCDPSQQRLERIRSFGADQSISWDEVRRQVGDTPLQPQPKDFDVVLDMSGDPAAVESAIALAAVGGRVMLVGSVLPTRPVQFLPEQVIKRLLKIVGVHNYAPEDLVVAVDFLQANFERFPFERLVERAFGLDQIEDAVRYALAKHPVRVAVLPKTDAPPHMT